MKALGDRRSTAELLIETAKTQHSQPIGSASSNKASVDSTMRLAHKLALEIGWDEGANLSSS